MSIRDKHYRGTTEVNTETLRVDEAKTQQSDNRMDRGEN